MLSDWENLRDHFLDPCYFTGSMPAFSVIGNMFFSHYMAKIEHLHLIWRT